MLEINKYIEFFLVRGLHLLRLRGKVPANLRWQREPLAPAEIRTHIEKGGNIGWRVGEEYLVIDIDPRNGGDKSFDDVCEKVGLDEQTLFDNYPTIQTGGGGVHIYTTKNPLFLPKKTNRQAFPGIDLIHGSNQILIPGCIHPETQRLYKPHILSAFQWGQDPPAIPEALQTFLEKHWGSLNSKAEQGQTKTHLMGTIKPNTMKEILTHIDPHEHQDDWVALILGMWHATGGDPEVIPLAIEWSRRDPEYREDPRVDKRVEQIWYSARDDFDDPKTVHSFLSLLERGEEEAVTLAARVRGGLIAAEFEAAESAAEDISTRIKKYTKEQLCSDKELVVTLVKEAIEAGEASEAAARTTLAKQLEVSVAKIAPYFKKVRTHLKAEKAAASKTKKEREKRKKDEWIIDFATRVLDSQFANGDHLCRGPNEQYYQYEEGRWVETGHEFIKAVIQPVIYQEAALHDPPQFDAPAMVKNVEEYLRFNLYRADDALMNRGKIPSCINCANGTVWVDEHTGSTEFKKHSPFDFLTHRIDTDYNPAATCPSFDRMLEQVFVNVMVEWGRSAYEDFIRHWWEVVGYAMQPNKNIPLVLIWHGSGLNGKTTISEIIMRLIGSHAVFATRLGSFSRSTDNHATTSLLGKLILLDDDVKTNTVLAEDLLKAYSENKLIEVNPKHKPKYTAVAHVTPLLLMNNRVVVRDRSHGMWRRLDVVHFGANLESLRDSPLPNIVRSEEMSGVLNAALAGLARLRARGGFQQPEVSEAWRNKFFNENNPVCRYIDRAWHAADPETSLTWGTLYHEYQRDSTARKAYLTEEFDRFTDIVKQMGFKHDRHGVYGVVVKGDF